jgi:hypothetical protein
MTRQNLLHCSIALVGLAVAGGAFGAEPTPTTPAPSVKPAVTSTTSATDGLICRDRLRPGSHIARRTCLTAAQWAARSMNTQPASAYAHESTGPWGQVSTAGASVGMSAFTAR